MFTGQVKAFIPRSHFSALPQAFNPELACGSFGFMFNIIIRWLISYLN
jgi:hypothetical protein